MARGLPRDEEILKIAAELFFENGYKGTRLEDIAREAGIRTASLYHYFESKERLYERLFAAVTAQVDLEDSRDDPELAPAERLVRMIHSRVTLAASHPVEYGIMSRHLPTLEGEVGEWARSYRRHFFAELVAVIAQGLEEGSFRGGDPESLASLAYGTITSVYEWLPALNDREGDGVDRARFVDQATAYAVSGVIGVAKARRLVATERAAASTAPAASEDVGVPRSPRRR